MSLFGKFYLNGREIKQREFHDLTQAAIDSDIQNGVFETLKIYKNARSPLQGLHAQRLLRGIESLYSESDILVSIEQLRAINTDFERQLAILSKCIGSEYAVVRYQVQLQSNTNELNYLIQIREYDELARVLDIQLSSLQLRSTNKSDGRKSIDRRIYTQASKTSRVDGLYDVILRDSSLAIVEGAKTNIFLLNNNELITPDLSHCGVAGVMRKYLVNKALLMGLNVTIATVSEAQLLSADAVFISNAVMGLRAVGKIFDVQGKRTNYELKSDSLAYENLLELQANIL